MKSIFNLIRETIGEFTEDKVTRLAAALSYYTVMSLAPLIIIALMIAGLVYDQSAAQEQLIGQVQSLIGASGAEAIEGILENASQPESGGVFATVASVVVLLFGASGVFGQLQDSLDTIWDVEPKRGQGIMGIIKDRFLSFTLVLGIGFLLLVSLILSTVLSAAGAFFESSLPFGEVFWQVINFVIPFAIITVLFALILKYVPDVQIKWRHVWIGALFTSFMFNIGKVLIGLYLGQSTVASSYGAAGSIVVILLWVYYSALILFLGAEFTQVYSWAQGEPIPPKENAVYITPEKRATQGMPLRSDPRHRPEILDKPQPGYSSPLAYPASDLLRRREGDANFVPVTGLEVPPTVKKVAPVLLAGAAASGFGLYELLRLGWQSFQQRARRRKYRLF